MCKDERRLHMELHSLGILAQDMVGFVAPPRILLVDMVDTIEGALLLMSLWS